MPIGPLGQVLLAHAEKNSNISFKWRHEVINSGQDEKSAWLVVKDQDGMEQRLSGDYVVGCDGGSSQVRKSLFGERAFPGITWDTQFVATDVSSRHNVPSSICPFYSLLIPIQVYFPFEKYGYDDCNAIVHPLEGHLVARLSTTGLWRVAYPEDKTLTHQQILDRQPAKYAHMLPGHPTPDQYTMTNISPYRLHQRSAQKYRVGRICLAGDAAHLCNPWGGLGLTGGFADVLGLCECLVGIERGWVKDADWILEKYDEVRRGIFRDVVDPISSANFMRVLSEDSDKKIEEDPIIQMCRKAKTDEKVREQLSKVSRSRVELFWLLSHSENRMVADQ